MSVTAGIHQQARRERFRRGGPAQGGSGLSGRRQLAADRRVHQGGIRQAQRPAGTGKATAACKKHRARPIIAKLDRLSRNVAFISALMERKVDFLAVDNPTATKFTVHILAAVAEFERDAKLSDIEPRFVCAACGRRGADVRPDWTTVPPLPKRSPKN